ncbi:fungal-specific transcription factor domain-containing protein [Phaeosphaeriaceae sp. PMI808]|nr:fungal-specific transcription factor domain-containing protein [Phaeosphaeriaceae sp. PMI808]
MAGAHNAPSTTARSTARSAVPGCRVCNRRRIKCDGARPACNKCISRGLQCPGYNKILKWIYGPASKGPSRLSFGPAGDKASSNPVHHHHHHHHQAADGVIVSPLVTPSPPVPLVPYRYTQLLGLLSSTPIPGTENFLLRHFVEVVSVQLAWFEDGSNPWRSLVLPLALDSPGSLLAAILGVSASNVASRLAEGDTQRDAYLGIMNSLRNRAFRFLAENLWTLRSALEQGTPPPPQPLIQMVIASVLLLSYLEVHWPSNGMWRIHLRTAQSINDMLELATTGDAISAFLSEELFTASTWPLLTHYPSDEMSSTQEVFIGSLARQEIRGCSPFTAFVAIVRRVTRAGRDASLQDGDPVERRAALLTILDQVQLDLEQALKTALGELRKMEARTVRNISGHDVERFIAAYYYATQIYCHRALFVAAPESPQESAWANQVTLLGLRAQLVDSLQALDNPDSLAQSQPWPLFVLATESAHEPVTQCWIESRMESIMTLYCEIDRPQMLNFLRSFWAQVVYDNWIDYARLWTKDQYEFLIL